MNRIGVCVSELATLPDIDRVCADIAAYGFTSVRFGVFWRQVQPTIWSTPNFTPITRARDTAAKHGLSLLPVLTGGAAMPTMAGWWNPTQRAQHFGTFCAAAAKTLPDCPLIEIWNEPNLHRYWAMGDPATFTPMLRAGTAAVRAAGRKAVLGGLAAETDWAGWSWGRWQNRAPTTFLAGINPADYDILGYHPYNLDPGFKVVEPSPGTFGLAQIPKLAALRKPLLFTEFGMDFDKITPKVGAEWITKQIPMLDADSWLYNWRDSGDQRFGLVDAGNTPRQPYYGTVQELIR